MRLEPLTRSSNVRHDLLVSNSDETTVANVFTRWGVWQFGNLAASYKTHFSELPSQTLHMHSTCNVLAN